MPNSKDPSKRGPSPPKRMTHPEFVKAALDNLNRNALRDKARFDAADREKALKEQLKESKASKAKSD
jgi:hypothetical protein